VNIYVGNLAYATTEAELRQAFEAFGRVESVSIIQDRETGRSKGFGFVVMPDATQAQAAVNGLNDKDVGGRRIRVNEARPRTDNGGGGGRSMDRRGSRESRW
jgi:RNA recognition motif-containing protein